jgi:diguanylate cyclase (GGDEF)-like protein
LCFGLVSALTLSTAAAADLEIRMLDAQLAPAAATVSSGALDARFQSFSEHAARAHHSALWLRVRAAPQTSTAPTLLVHTDRGVGVQVFAAGAVLPVAFELPAFAGAHEAVWLLPPQATTVPLYLYVVGLDRAHEPLHIAGGTLASVLARGAVHARMIDLAFGALTAMALAALLIWCGLSDRMFLLYASLFGLQALYLAFHSGQALEWPGLGWTRALESLSWNVPIALSGAVACLFVREIADLRRFSPRVYAIFGVLAALFVLLAAANLAHLAGHGQVVATIGNVLFVSVAAFTLVVAFLAWRHGSRAAGWFVLAWLLLVAATIATSARLLFTRPDRAEWLMYYGLPLSMVAAAVLIALGVADRLRDQRVALSEAERRAETDPLTGVLNRRSLVERLEAVCARARARGLAVAVLFIDLDHFKDINDTFGHAAGDACLAAIIGPMQTELRQSDVIGRYGGEEFVVILSSADAAAAHPVAQRILERVRGVRVEGFGKPIELTCSIGVAASDTRGEWGEQLIKQADAAVYVAKRRGRNCVQLAEALAAW